VVEIKGKNGMFTACSTQVTDGMEIQTDTPSIRLSRLNNLQLIFSEHCEECNDCVLKQRCSIKNLAKEYRVPITKFPSVHENVAKLLLERGVTGIGIDTLSADTGADGFPVHRAILGAGKYLVENVANAKELPPTGAKIAVLPMKIKDGTEAPIRLIAF
jgi:kynurenine formamidase